MIGLCERNNKTWIAAKKLFIQSNEAPRHHVKCDNSLE